MSVRCWICKDGNMEIQYDGREWNGLPLCECSTCGSIADAQTVARHSRIARDLTRNVDTPKEPTDEVDNT